MEGGQSEASKHLFVLLPLRNAQDVAHPRKDALHHLLTFLLPDPPIRRYTVTVEEGLAKQIVQLGVPKPTPLLEPHCEGRVIMQLENEIGAFGHRPPVHLLNPLKGNLSAKASAPRPPTHNDAVFEQRRPTEP